MRDYVIFTFEHIYHKEIRSHHCVHLQIDVKLFLKGRKFGVVSSSCKSLNMRDLRVTEQRTLMQLNFMKYN
jgi:hypothetical protein